MSRERLWVVAGVALAVVLAVAVGVVVWLGQDDTADCDAALETRARQMSEPIGGRTVAVLGDSYTQGTGLAGPEVAWPAALEERLGAPVVIDGVGSTGFTTRGFCTGAEVTYGARLDDDWAEAEVVVVQGGVNDALTGRPDDVAAAAEDVLGELEEVPTVVVVGPPSIPAAEAEELSTVDAALRQAAEDAGRAYVPLLGKDIPLLDDRVHPTEAGHQRIAELVAAALETAGRPQ
ncbi:SGNH/GDSL hydrolase family protein [Candidatus Blastococcus massiliensis]|uniref:SGNH/GDSL hydrolase family protein n=1 Tax=Candidatus Blastococcus massiliensis TaxID=1470358 RepID=UPI0012DC5A0B|nr:SGNH/GDSL hydrolase family protein [Candidatus Blastococcus massiliensis]